MQIFSRFFAKKYGFFTFFSRFRCVYLADDCTRGKEFAFFYSVIFSDLKYI